MHRLCHLWAFASTVQKRAHTRAMKPTNIHIMRTNHPTEYPPGRHATAPHNRNSSRSAELLCVPAHSKRLTLAIIIIVITIMSLKCGRFACTFTRSVFFTANAGGDWNGISPRCRRCEREKYWKTTARLISDIHYVKRVSRR